jgi:hypothetical protein
LAFREFGPQCGEKLVRHIRRGAGQAGDEAQHQLFPVVEMRTLFESRQIIELLVGDACPSANGRMNVDSKRAAHHYGNLDLRQLF